MATREPHSLCTGHGKRPDGVTLELWHAVVNCLAWVSGGSRICWWGDEVAAALPSSPSLPLPWICDWPGMPHARIRSPSLGGSYAWTKVTRVPRPAYIHCNSIVIQLERGNAFCVMGTHTDIRTICNWTLNWTYCLLVLLLLLFIINNTQRNNKIINN